MITDSSAVRRRVLIVDDNADAALMLSMFIDVSGHDTAVAYSGQEALATAPVFNPEIVLLDLGMPGMSGYEVAVALRKIPHLSKVFISALTGWHDLQTRRQVAACGFDHHLVKPADVDAVLQLIARLPA